MKRHKLVQTGQTGTESDIRLLRGVRDFSSVEGSELIFREEQLFKNIR